MRSWHSKEIPRYAGVVGLQTVLVDISRTEKTKTITFGNLTYASQCIPFWSQSTDRTDSYTNGSYTEYSVDIFDNGGVVTVTMEKVYNGPNPGNSHHAITLIEFALEIEVNKHTYINETVSSPNYYWDKTIAPVNPNASFAVLTAQHPGTFAGGYIIGMTNMACQVLTSSTNLRIYMIGNGLVIPKIIVYTVSDPTEEIFTTTATQGSATGTTNTVNITVPDNEPSTTFAVVGFHANSGSASYPNVQFSNKHTWSCLRTSNTNYEFRKLNGNSVSYVARMNVQLVTFHDGTRVQHGSRIYTTETNINETISPVDVAKSFAIGTINNTFANARNDTDSSGCPMGRHSFRLNITGPTTVNTFRFEGNDPGAYGFQVLTIP